MAPRIGYTLRVLNEISPAACGDDPRLVWKSGDETNLGIADLRTFEGADRFTNLPPMNPRQMRLLAAQIVMHADALDRVEPHTETVL